MPYPVFTPPVHQFLVDPGAAFSAASAPTTAKVERPKRTLKRNVLRIAEAQEKLYADNHYSVLLIFQAMDAAGKDSTIRAILSGVNPAGCQVFSFKQPSPEELDHDFLWRSARRLPERGRIGVFNRSYYEETLVVRVHPEYLANQRLPLSQNYPSTQEFWDSRFQSIRDHEAHLARNGTVVLKFWLNVSVEEQTRRFLARLNTPEKLWKFSGGDVVEQGFWDDYMAAYNDALLSTSTSWAPWYAIPADSKKNMRAMVSEIVANTLESLPLQWPEVSDSKSAELQAYREKLSP